MQPFDLYPWQNQNWRQLTEWLDMDRMPHAMLFSGLSGIGKTRLAFYFVQTLLCTAPLPDRKACGNCKSCLLFSAGTHPDFGVLEPDQADKPITIDRIRELRHKLSLSPQYGGYRVFLIRPAHKMNSNAVNALLKTLEEPNPQTLLILLSDCPSMLPATILSRCQQMVLPRPDFGIAVSWLSELVEPNKAEVLLSLNNGSPLAALALIKGDFMEKRKPTFNTWMSIADNSSDLVSVTQQWLEISLPLILTWISTWTIDIIRLHNHPQTLRLNNPDLRESLQAQAQRLNLTQLFGFFDLLLRAKALLDTQVNPQMLLEEILIEWQSLNREP